MKLLQAISGHRRSLVRAIGRRYFAASTEEYAKRNYANNESEYNTVIASLTSKRRHYLLRDVYDDMMLDGVKPERDTFHSLIVGTMKGARLQDAFFFRDEMKVMGLVPDVALYNFLISTCGKCKNSQQAIRILDEMKRYEVKPTGQTYICLLNACAAAGRIDRVYAIVRDMTAAGLGLNKFCYAGLIAAHKNKTPITDDTASKIIELVEQSKGWSSVEASRDNAENVMMGISEEELYNIPTAEYIHRRGGFLLRQLTVFHVAFHACADLRNVEAMETLLEMLSKDGKTPDVFIVMQIMRLWFLIFICDMLRASEDAHSPLLDALFTRQYDQSFEGYLNSTVFTVSATIYYRCYLHSGDIDRGQKTFEDYMNSGKPAMVELYVTLAEGATVGHTPKGMQLALETLTGGYTMANYVWDLMQSRKIIPSYPAVEAYYHGLKERDIPKDDQRLMLVSRTYDDLRLRMGPGLGRS
ncbi:pentatricopeptide repeat (PPR) superfamily protein [Actinidia rufa]|uniref:Pentatricopeptide repeat (PPR) superfamily protein n=1 Tax=Actinidia rufa TaxID=165716 RepID=A0A7J0H7J5_9ERIC|nr:pentatricopeptide repeat (PPR) superfamily protein [Actinidia rufa]